MTPPLRLRRDVTACDTDAGMVLLDERTGRYWQLNTTAAHILRRLLDGQDADRITDDLTRTHRVRRDQVADDIDALLGRLARAGLTERHPQP